MLATDAFKSATSGLTSPQAAATIERFTNVTDAAIPDILNAYRGELVGSGDIPAEFLDRRITTLGRWGQTVEAGDAGERILKVPEIPNPSPGGPTSTWSNTLNALWIREAIERGDVIHLVTRVAASEDSLLGLAKWDGISIYTRELNELLAANYIRFEDYLLPPF